MKVTIDRFEEDIAVLLLPDGTVLNAPAKLFCEANEGDTVNITVDKEDTASRKKRVEGLMDSLFKD